MLLYPHWDNRLQTVLFVLFMVCSVLILPLIALGFALESAVLVYSGIAAAPMALVVGMIMVIDDWRFIQRRIACEENLTPLFEETSARPLQRVSIYDDVVVINAGKSHIIPISEIRDICRPGLLSIRTLDLQLVDGRNIPLYLRNWKSAQGVLRACLECNRAPRSLTA